MALVTVHVLKVDDSDCFYHIVLCPINTPKLGIIFSLEEEDKEVLAILITLPIGWKNHRPCFARRQRQWRI